MALELSQQFSGVGFFRADRFGNAMTSRSFVALALLLLLAGCTGRSPDGSASEPAPVVAAGSWGLKLDDTWTYAVKADGQNATLRKVFVGEEVVGGRGALVFEAFEKEEFSVEGPPTRERYANDSFAAIDIVRQFPLFEIHYDPPFGDLFPPQDRSYEGRILVRTTFGSQTARLEGNVTYRGTEEVVTPAGTFQAHRYHTNVRYGEETQETDAWFAPEARAIVKLETSKRSEILQSYKLG